MWGNRSSCVTKFEGYSRCHILPFLVPWHPRALDTRHRKNLQMVDVGLECVAS
jgi:hypothetical protein